MNFRLVAGLLLAVVVALFLRCGDLAERPLHNDEAINAFKLRELWTQGTYRYDPHEYHGPALYYLSLPIVRVASWTAPEQPDESAMRAVAVVFGVGLVTLFFLPLRTFGFGAVFVSALLAAVSPVMVYYSRYYIHELLLVFAGGVWLVGWQRLAAPAAGALAPAGKSWAWAVFSGIGLGLMWATKETFVFMLAAALGTWLLVVGFGPDPNALSGSRAHGWTGILRRVRAASGLVPWRHLALASAVALLVGGILFTSFLANPGGVLDSARAYFIWGERAGGASPHVHPWHFFLERLLWYRWRGGPLWTEAFVAVLAILGGFRAFRDRGEWPPERVRLARFLVLYTVLLGSIYSVIRYKTPWCVLGFYVPALGLAGLGGADLWCRAMTRGRWMGVGVGVLLLAGTGHLAVQSWRTTREWAADFRNPWVYGHTSSDITNLLAQVDELNTATPTGQRTPLWVVAAESNYWPLPWYLRRRENVGWWDSLPAGDLPPLLIVSSKLGVGIEEKTSRRWTQAGMFELRPRFFVELYVETGLWKTFLENRAARR